MSCSQVNYCLIFWGLTSMEKDLGDMPCNRSSSYFSSYRTINSEIACHQWLLVPQKGQWLFSGRRHSLLGVSALSSLSVREDERFIFFGNAHCSLRQHEMFDHTGTNDTLHRNKISKSKYTIAWECGVLTDSDGIFKSHKKRAAIANKLKPLRVQINQHDFWTEFQFFLRSLHRFCLPPFTQRHIIHPSVIKNWPSVTNYCCCS